MINSKFFKNIIIFILIYSLIFLIQYKQNKEKNNNIKNKHDNSLIIKDYNLMLKNLITYISREYNIDILSSTNIVNCSFQEAKQQNYDPLLLLSLIGIESTYNASAYSKMGAIGLTQIMPIYHIEKINKIKEKENLDVWSINGNIKIGALILKEYINLYNGQIEKALQKYNGSSYDKNFTYSNKILSNQQKLYQVAMK